MKKSKWFFPVTDTDSAKEAIKMAYQTAFALAAIQAVLVGFLSWSNPALAVNLADSLFMVALGLILRNRLSRFAALTLFLYSIFIAYFTFAARAGIATVGYGGKNTILAVLFLYASYKGVQGTFGFHRIHKTRTNIKSILFLSAIIFGYTILVTAIYIGVMLIPQVESTFENMSESLMGALWLVPVITVILLGTLKLLPGTKSIKVVQDADKHSMFKS
ncbi:hypothetical protein TI05_04230 [Achromatium sp. WMS3]|nr:hypothetical protein TI05_04230 [Achromatium sp. WMS3]